MKDNYMTKYIPKRGNAYWKVLCDFGIEVAKCYREKNDEVWYEQDALDNNVFKTKALALLAKKDVEKALREAKKM